MTETPPPSGLDLARQALAAYKATAKNTPTPSPRKPRRTTRPARGEGRDPQGLAGILGRLTTEQGWTDSLNGGNLIDQWATIAPTELASTVHPVAYDPEHGILKVRPSSPAYATQVRLFQQQLAKHLNTQLGRPAVRTIRVLPPGGHTTTTADEQPPPSTPEPFPQREPRRPAPEGYQAARELLLAHRPERQPGNPYIAEADARQVAALRAGRQPEDEHRDAVWAQETTGPERGSVEESLARARAYARQHRGGGEPRRAFDVA